jgi:hypothetical protein
MDSFASDIMDVLSGKNPNFPNITIAYPEFQVDKHSWKRPFQEGGINGYDEIVLRVGTIYNQYIVYTESYVITPTTNECEDIIINKLKENLIKKIEMSKLLKECKKAVDVEIREECRQEAMAILELATDDVLLEFLEFHKKNQGNVCCLVLDFAKKELIKSGKLEQKEGDCFKDPYTELYEKIGK